MDYKKIYNKLVESRKIRPLLKEKGFEIHHILPKCLGGEDSDSNLVKLTYREHYIAHWILTKIYPNESKIHYGFLCMIRDPNGFRNLNSRMIQTIKTNFSEFKKWHSKQCNPGKTINSRVKAKQRMDSENNPIRKNPEKNHTVKKIYVEYCSGEKKIFLMKKDLAKEIKQTTDLSDNAIRTRINKNNLQEYGYSNIVMEQKINKPANSCIGRKWYNDGHNNVFCFPGEEPQGYIIGMLRKNNAIEKENKTN
jgi:hypothetical protein